MLSVVRYTHDQFRFWWRRTRRSYRRMSSASSARIVASVVSSGGGSRSRVSCSVAGLPPYPHEPAPLLYPPHRTPLVPLVPLASHRPSHLLRTCSESEACLQPTGPTCRPALGPPTWPHLCPLADVLPLVRASHPAHLLPLSHRSTPLGPTGSHRWARARLQVGASGPPPGPPVPLDTPSEPPTQLLCALLNLWGARAIIERSVLPFPLGCPGPFPFSAWRGTAFGTRGCWFLHLTHDDDARGRPNDDPVSCTSGVRRIHRSAKPTTCWQAPVAAEARLSREGGVRFASSTAADAAIACRRRRRASPSRPSDGRTAAPPLGKRQFCGERRGHAPRQR